MTVESALNRKTYAGDNVSTSFDTSPVVFFDTSDLQVSVTDTTTGVVTDLTENTHYTVSGGDGLVGTVDLSTGSSPHGALLSGTTLVILRTLPITQGVDFVNNDNSDAEVAERALDRLTMVEQQHEETLGRAVRFAAGDVSGTTTEIPDVTTRAGRLLGFDATGLLTTFVVQVGTSIVDLASSIGATLIGYIQAGTGAVLRTLQSRLREEISVKDFGAVGDGVTNDSAAFQAALTYAATIGGTVRVPSSTSNYYMGSVGLTMSGSVCRLKGDNYVPLVWDAAFNGTAITVTGNYNVIENLILFKPKSVAAPNAAIIAIDLQGPLNTIRHVRTDQTSAGNNSGWTTGVKVGAISCSIEQGEFYTYDIGILVSGGSVRNDLTITDTIAVAQITAAIKAINASTISIRDCDLEGSGGATALYGIWLNTTTVECAGCQISGNYFQGFSNSGIFCDANASFPVRGLSVNGNEINNSAGTNAVRLSNTVGVSIRGNYLKGGTSYLRLENTNTDTGESENYRSGALTIGGTFTPDFVGSVQAFTPTLNSFTIVNGTGGITATGTYTKFGNIIFWLVIIAGTGTATIASTANTSNITGLPIAPNRENTGTVQNGSIDLTSTGIYVATDAKIWPPTWAAHTPATTGHIILSGWYDCADA